jgi:hypothetical protein
LSCYYPTYGENHFSSPSPSTPEASNVVLVSLLCLFVCTLFVIALMENEFQASKREAKNFIPSPSRRRCMFNRKKAFCVSLSADDGSGGGGRTRVVESELWGSMIITIKQHWH